MGISPACSGVQCGFPSGPYRHEGLHKIWRKLATDAASLVCWFCHVQHHEFCKRFSKNPSQQCIMYIYTVQIIYRLYTYEFTSSKDLSCTKFSKAVEACTLKHIASILIFWRNSPRFVHQKEVVLPHHPQKKANYAWPQKVISRWKVALNRWHGIFWEALPRTSWFLTWTQFLWTWPKKNSNKPSINYRWFPTTNTNQVFLYKWI